MEVMARAKYVRRTPRKARLVADQVRGLRVSDALAQLEFSPKHAARDVAKAIKSAAANAEHNHNLERDELWLKQILVDEGPTIKRIRPVSRGMAHQYFHRTCHITAIVEDRPEVAPARPARRRRPAAPPRSPEVEEPQADADVGARRATPSDEDETNAEEVGARSASPSDVPPTQPSPSEEGGNQAETEGES
jgi:large subunit ribosomal protein L22